MTIPTLSTRQQRVLDFIQAAVERNGCPPTLREIAEALELSSHSSAQACIISLVNKGALERTPQHRGLRVAHAGPRRAGMSLPLVGRVAAGAPLLALENIERHVEVDPALFQPSPDYLLRVVGLSMRDVGILDGDLIAVQRNAAAENGQIVVARLDDEVTVKRFQRQRDRIRLLPANPDFAPIEITPDSDVTLTIEGRCVGIIRSL